MTLKEVNCNYARQFDVISTVRFLYQYVMTFIMCNVQASPWRLLESLHFYMKRLAHLVGSTPLSLLNTQAPISFVSKLNPMISPFASW